MRRATLLIAVLALTPLATVMAQLQPLPLEPGQRVRVTAPDLGIRKQVGRFEALRGDTLVVAAADSTMTFPVVSVTRLELSWGQRSMARRGAGIGFLSGATIGAIIGFAAGDDTNCFICFTAEDKAAAGAIVLGGIGALIGLAVGSHKTDLWEEVPLDQLRVSVGPQRDGRLGLGLSFAF